MPLSFISRLGWKVVEERNSTNKVGKEIEYPLENGLDAHTQNFVNAIRNNTPNSVNCSPDKATDVAIVAHMGNISYRSGQKLNWDRKKKQFTDDLINKKYLTKNIIMAIIYHPTSNFLCALGYVLCIGSIFGQDHLPSPKETEVWEPEPITITFDENGIPSDAIVLFDGTNLSKWQSSKGNGIPPSWTINDDGSMTVTPGKGSIETIEEHGSIQLHIEWKSPDVITGKGQSRGNSGIIFQRRYEVQVLDSYQNRTYSNGQAASIYKQHIPLVNATKPPSEWQVYDIIFIEPTFNEQGETITSGRFTVFHNDVIVQNSVEILGTTEYIGAPKRGRDDMPGYDADTSTDRRLYLQDHGDYVSYRNIWIRRL